MGGIPGRSPPPSPRLASLYRRLTSMTASSTLSSEFSVSLEGTHHGPWLTTPSLFAEIGSVPAHWERRDVADLWAEVLFVELGLGGDEVADAVGVHPGSYWWHECHGEDGKGESGPAVVLVCVGGGHYAPRHGDAIRGGGSRVLLGHILPSYTMDLAGEASEWQACVREAVEATRRAFVPASPEVVCYVDKKAFKAEQRGLLIDFIENQLGLRTALKPSDILGSRA